MPDELAAWKRIRISAATMIKRKVYDMSETERRKEEEKNAWKKKRELR